MRKIKQRGRTWISAKPTIRDFGPVLVILLIAGAMAWRGTQEKSNTADESVHILAGYNAWTYQDFRVNPENGTIPGRIAALPLLRNDESLVDTSSRQWKESDQWHLADRLLFSSGLDYQRVLNASHLCMLLFNLAGLGVIFFLSASLWGRGGGYFSLILAALSPNFLGHMPLAASDFAGAWSLALAAFAFAKLCEAITLRHIFFVGATAAFAILCKQSGGVIFFIGLVLIFWCSAANKPLKISFAGKEISPGGFTRQVSSLFLGAGTSALFCLLLIWTAYGFRYAAANPKVGEFVAFQIDWSLLPENSLTPITTWLRSLRVIPESLLYGLDFIFAHSERGAFLNGTFSQSGFPSYYLWSFLYKTPPAALVLHITGLVFCLSHIIHVGWKKVNLILAALLTLAVIYAIVLFLSGISIGHRHAFPILYVSCILAGICVPEMIAKGRKAVVPFCLIVGLILPSTLANLNNPISYMNVFGGGQSEGYKRLSNSSLDWGQDLPSAVEAINQFRKENPGREVYVSYFGTADPLAYGLRDVVHLRSWGIYHIRKRPDFRLELGPGLYVISASELVATPEDWTKELELKFQYLKVKAGPLYDQLEKNSALDPEAAASILSDEDLKTLEDFELFRAQRLKTFLYNREPDSILNGTILLFDLPSEEIDLYAK